MKITTVKLFVIALFITSLGFSQTTTFNFTGSIQTYTVSSTGTYHFELWGAQGGEIISYLPSSTGGKGGYASGDITLTSGQIIYIYVGGK